MIYLHTIIFYILYTLYILSSHYKLIFTQTDNLRCDETFGQWSIEDIGIGCRFTSDVAAHMVMNISIEYIYI